MGWVCRGEYHNTPGSSVQVLPVYGFAVKMGIRYLGRSLGEVYRVSSAA